YAKINGLTYDASSDEYSEHTIAAWLRMDAGHPDGEHVIVSFDPSHYWQLGINIDAAGPGVVVWQVHGTDGTIYTCTSGSTLVNDGKWHHVAATFHDGLLKLFIDGDEVGQVTADAQTFGSVISAEGYVGVGSSAENNTHTDNAYLMGDLDQVRIYPMALSDYEIAGLSKGFAYDFYTWNACFASQGELFRVNISPGDGNRVANADFSSGQANWTLWSSADDGAAATLSVVDGAANIDVIAGGTKDWHIQFFQNGIVLEAGTEYTVTFDAKCNSGTMDIRSQVRDQGFANTYDSDFILDTEMKSFSYTFTAVEGNENARIEFFFGSVGANSLVIDNVFLGIEGAMEDITVTQLYPEHQDFVDVAVNPSNVSQAFVLRKPRSGTGDMGGRELHRLENYGNNDLVYIRRAPGLSRYGSVNINPADHDHIVMSTSREANVQQSLTYSTNAGNTWGQVNRSTTVNNDGVIIVPSIQSYAPMVSYTYDSGGVPERTGAGTTTDIMDIQFVPGEANAVLWAEVSLGLLRSDDRGANFSSYGVGGTNKDTYQIAVGPYGQRIIVGMLESGYCVTHNGGLFWDGVHHHNDAGIISSSEKFTGRYGEHQGFGVGINQDDPNMVAVIHSGDEHILISTDGGLSFTDVNQSTNGGKRVFWPSDELLYASDHCADNAGQLLRDNSPLVWRHMERRVVAVSTADPNVILGVYNPTDPAGYIPASMNSPDDSGWWRIFLSLDAGANWSQLPEPDKEQLPGRNLWLQVIGQGDIWNGESPHTFAIDPNPARNPNDGNRTEPLRVLLAGRGGIYEYTEPVDGSGVPNGDFENGTWRAQPYRDGLADSPHFDVDNRINDVLFDPRPENAAPWMGFVCFDPRPGYHHIVYAAKTMLVAKLGGWANPDYNANARWGRGAPERPFYRSTDGGVTWENLHTSDYSGTIYNFADTFDINVDLMGNFYASTVHGVYIFRPEGRIEFQTREEYVLGDLNGQQGWAHGNSATYSVADPYNDGYIYLLDETAGWQGASNNNADLSGGRTAYHLSASFSFELNASVIENQNTLRIEFKEGADTGYQYDDLAVFLQRRPNNTWSIVGASQFGSQFFSSSAISDAELGFGPGDNMSDLLELSLTIVRGEDSDSWTFLSSLTNLETGQEVVSHSGVISSSTGFFDAQTLDTGLNTMESNLAGVTNLRIYSVNYSADPEVLPTAFETWAAQNGVSADLLADTDGDGRTYLEEFAFGGKPNDSKDNEIVPTLDFGQNQLTFSHLALRDFESGIEYVVEYTSDIESGLWNEANWSAVKVQINPDPDFNEVDYTMMLPEYDRLFFRVSLTQE
ncbi:MAG: LamG-like jellyroll fold domain-containing protein, partial [Bacteroidota bacterium]